jgi:phosphoribosylglycinamide formyltransferase 1
MKNLVIFASGRGSNFEAILLKIRQGRLGASVRLVVSNNPDAGALATAAKFRIPTRVLEPDIADADLVRLLRESGADLVVLAGYMKKVPPAVVAAFRNRIVNIHPALLPSFGGPGCYGLRVHEKVLEAGVKVTGATVHFVDEEYDRGPVVMQATVPVRDGDDPETLQKRVLRAEHGLYWKAVRLVLSGRFHIEGRRVVRT